MTAPARRRLLLTAATVLALGVTAAVGVGVLRSPADEAPSRGTSATTAQGEPVEGEAARAADVGTGDVLTRGPLLRASPPSGVSIPKLRVDVPIIGLGLAADGSMQVPADATTVGWFTRAPAPGSLGPAVLAGHVDYQGRPGSFAGIGTLAIDDPVHVRRRDGSTAVFAVTNVERHAKNRFPTDAVYGPIDHAGLRLITCGGDFDTRSGHYEDNIVVYARLRSATPS